MAREGVLPARLATLHRRFQTPVVATVAVTVLGTVLALLVGYRLASTDLGASPAISVYYFFATLGTLVVIVVYIGLCVAATTYFRRAEHRANVFLRLLAPVIGTAVFGVALSNA
jgi:amino acid transporter